MNFEGTVRQVDAQWRHLLSETPDTNDIPCVKAAWSDWWLDPDLGERGPNGSDVRENQLRAGLLCYECPIISGCRRRGALEEYNVWGGLTANQRRRLAKGLVAGTTSKSLPMDRGGLERGEVQAFKAGWSISDLAASSGRPASAILRALRVVLWRSQASWEERNAAVCSEVSGLVRNAHLAGR